MNKPVAWMMKANDPDNDKDWLCFGRLPTRDEKVSHSAIPLYTHPHPDNLGLAESIIKQQQLKIDNLLENNARLDAEIEVLKSHPAELTDEEIRELGRMSRKWQDPYVWLAKRINRPLKDLTNKEIQEVITEHEWYGWTLEQFAKAILRKAQEK